MNGQEWIFLTVAEAVAACNFMLRQCKPSSNYNMNAANVTTTAAAADDDDEEEEEDPQGMHDDNICMS